MSADHERFYQLLDRLSSDPRQGGCLGDYTGRAPWPARGVYFFREPGEQRASVAHVGRIVRVGTHAVSVNAKSTLWGRLRAHRGGRNGGGNHRGSIFRLHIGAAQLILNREQLTTWGRGASATSAVRSEEVELERRVSAYLGSMTVLWVAVPDQPGPKSQRATIERNAIALLSNRLHPMDTPSPTWLGRNSPTALIRGSGLWNLNHVEEDHEPAFLNLLESAVERTCLARRG